MIELVAPPTALFVEVSKRILAREKSELVENKRREIVVVASVEVPVTPRVVVVAFVAENRVVVALVVVLLVKLTLVPESPAKNPLVNESPVPDIPVVEALVMVVRPSVLILKYEAPDDEATLNGLVAGFACTLKV